MQPFPANGQPPAPIPLQAPRPRATRMSRLMMVCLIGVGLLLIAFSLLIMLKPPAPKTHREAEANTEWVRRADGLDRLPAGYDKLPKRQPAPEPQSPLLPPTLAPRRQEPAHEQTHTHPVKQGPSEAEKAEQAARKSSLFFADSKTASGGRDVGAVTPSLLPPGPEPEGTPGGRAATNSKEAFLKRAAALQPTLLTDQLHAPPGPNVVMAGTIIPASLLMGINSDLPGPLLAQVRENVYDSVTHTHILIPQGTKVIGTYDSQVVYGEKRVLVVWQRLRLPNEYSIQLEGMQGVDLAGYSGIAGKVDAHFWDLMKAVLLSSVLSVGSRVPFGNQEGFAPTLTQEFAQDFASAANRAGQSLVNRELSRKPTIDVAPGRSFNIFAHRDMVLPIYNGDVVNNGR